ncbi:zinc protease [Lysobacter helvus]|uniref:Zinc protease n=2 Tax=Lysobacteraceae TaxID=32033 RepID=A0ABM7Q4T7_9GAMM|nr:MULTISPECIES: pitrilysin family protein [Lysobacter]BCT92338.1 zinc protease [Lysobacter caseinilyticus]BCT95491.1 zinc protease [Lysobacter helvus]
MNPIRRPHSALATCALSLALSFAIGGTAFVPSIAHAASPKAELDIPYEAFTLSNGLRVIVHTDRKAPVVSVAIWYHVGSKDEPTGRTGFAHLFEHLMFNGSENHKGEYFGPFEMAGVSDINGNTWLDRTMYFETVPTTALDMALWMESDRMGHLLGAIDQATLDEQRGVVQNEKRQGENEPYGRVDERMLAQTFPANHPYHHDTIGSMADLNAASLDDVKTWFRTYYGAANTVLVLSGDIDAATAKAKVQQYFGDIAPGPAVARQAQWVAPRTTSTRDQMEDTVAQTRIYREWNIPARDQRDFVMLYHAAGVMGGGKTSRLYQRLVYKDKLVDDVQVDVTPFELASQFVLTADVKQGVDPKKVEAAIAEEWQRFLAEGPTQDELARLQAQDRAGTIRGLERALGKASRLGESALYLGSPDAWKKLYAWNQEATPADVQAAAKKWLSQGDYTLTVVPVKEAPKIEDVAGLPASKDKPADIPGTSTASLKATPGTVDRSKGVPEVTSFPDIKFPQVQRGKLKNGIEVVLAERHTVPTVGITLQFDGGYASDAGRKLGTASFTSAMLDEGTQSLDSVEIAQRRERLGMNLSTGCNLDSCSASANVLKAELAPSLALFSDVVRNPAFRDADVERIRAQWLAGIAQEKTQPTSLALRTLPPLLYGAGHPYAIPFTGSGTEADIQALTTTDMRGWQAAWLRPDNVRIFVAGDTTLAEITKQLDAAFGDWKAPSVAKGTKTLPKVAEQTAPRVFLVDKPGAQQSLILAGLLAPPTTVPNDLEIQTMNGAFGGAFTARLNMNLRENKHWAYGAYSFYRDALGQRPYMLYAPVQTDKTAESANEIRMEVNDVIGKRPLSTDEIAKIKANDVRGLPGSYETASAVLSALTSNALYGRPDDYVSTLKARTEAQTDDAVRAAATEIIKPKALTWVIVGDLSQIEQKVRKLDLGQVSIIDADGKPVTRAAVAPAKAPAANGTK